jgi:hypothetical protein
MQGIINQTGQNKNTTVNRKKELEHLEAKNVLAE